MTLKRANPSTHVNSRSMLTAIVDETEQKDFLEFAHSEGVLSDEELKDMLS